MREPTHWELAAEDALHPEWAEWRNTPWPAGEPQWHFLTDRIATGGECRNASDVKRTGKTFTHVLDCRGEYSDRRRFSLLAPHVRYGWVGTGDDGSEKGADWFGPGIDFTLAALDEPGSRILIHCAEGINRGPSMAFAVLRTLGYSRRQTEQLMKKRPCAWFRYDDDFEHLVLAGHLTVPAASCKVTT